MNTRDLPGIESIRAGDLRAYLRGAGWTMEKSVGPVTIFSREVDVPRDPDDPDLPAREVVRAPYMVELQQRYQQKARAAVANKLSEGGDAEFDALVAVALQQPMTSLGDLKGWLAEWRQVGGVEYIGLAVGGTALAVNKKHRVRRRVGFSFG